jgi:integrase
MPTMHSDLFQSLDADGASPLVYAHAFESWLREKQAASRLRQDSSGVTYASMWKAFSDWAVARSLVLQDLTVVDLEAYIASRGHAEDLSPRYVWRLLRLLDAVLRRHCTLAEHPVNDAAHTLLMQRPEWRYAQASHNEELPSYLAPGRARRLVAWLIDPARGQNQSPDEAEGGKWQGLRNRTAVALQLGAGLTPGDVRAALLSGVVTDGARVAGLPWKLRLPAHGAVAEREVPLAPWAARLLRQWLLQRSQQGIPGPLLFTATRSGRAWGKVAQYNAARSVLAAAGVDDADGGSFLLRHTFALRQLRRGTPPDEVSRWLGLTDPQPMRRYLRVIAGPVDVV